MKKAWILIGAIGFYLQTSLANALPFNIVTKAGTTLPTTVSSDSTVTAYYTVTNNTGTQRDNNNVKYLPPNTVQVTTNGTYADTCGTNFSLASNGQPGSSCTLQLTISGAIDASDPNLQHHLFVCFPGDVTCAGTLDSLNVTLIPPSTKAFAYVTVSLNQTIYYCSINTDGTFSDCKTNASATRRQQAIPASVAPMITLDPAHHFLYLPSNSSATNYNVIKACAINTDGSIGHCDIALGGVDNPTSIAFNPQGTAAYVGNSANIYRCTPNSDGIFTPCETTGSELSQPTNIAINPAGTFAYVVTSSNSTISYCPIASEDNTLGACQSGATGFSNLGGIAVNPEGSFLYVSATGSNQVFYCPINTNGSLGSCTATGSGFNSPAQIVFNAAGTIAYIANLGGNSVSYCSINSDGSLGNCNTMATTFNQLTGIAL